MPRCATQLVPQNTLSKRTVRRQAMQRWTLRQVARRQLQQHTEADRGGEADIRGDQPGCRTRGDGRATRPAVHAEKVDRRQHGQREQQHLRLCAEDGRQRANRHQGWRQCDGLVAVGTNLWRRRISRATAWSSGASRSCWRRPTMLAMRTIRHQPRCLRRRTCVVIKQLLEFHAHCHQRWTLEKDTETVRPNMVRRCGHGCDVWSQSGPTPRSKW